MPEGHSIRRYADQHRDLLRGMEVAAASPQGRFSRGAARISGRVLLEVDTHGKHLFYRWQRAESLHVHLGLYGRFKTYLGDPAPPTPATRLELKAGDVTVYLAGPSTCELITPSQEEAVMQRLGPDPLKAGSDGNTGAALAARLSRRSISIGAALLDQSVIAGLGNIYRAEVLFVAGVHPLQPANSLDPSQVEAIWATSSALLSRGVSEGVIATFDQSITGSQPRNAEDRLYVYGRDRSRCRTCGGPISTAELANRKIWWCNRCQHQQPH